MQTHEKVGFSYRGGRGRTLDGGSHILGKIDRPSHATVVAYSALFIALGGVSYAAVALPINSVGSKQIKRGAVKKSDLGKSAVTAAKVKDGSLLSTDFRAGQLPAGPKGDACLPTIPQCVGPKGDKGDPGTNGTNGATNVTTVSATCTGEPCHEATATCPAGQKATGGGGIAGGNQYLWRSLPSPTTGAPTGWTATAGDPSSTPAPTGQVTAYVVCAAP